MILNKEIPAGARLRIVNRLLGSNVDDLPLNLTELLNKPIDECLGL